MKDFLDQTIKVGDWVIFGNRQYASLEVKQVFGLTAQNIRVVDLLGHSKYSEHLCSPHTVFVLKDIESYCSQEVCFSGNRYRIPRDPRAQVKLDHLERVLAANPSEHDNERVVKLFKRLDLFKI